MIPPSLSTFPAERVDFAPRATLAPAAAPARAPAVQVPRHLAIVADAGEAPDSIAALRETIAACAEQGIRWLSVGLPGVNPPRRSAPRAEPDCRFLRELSGFVRGEADALARQGVRLSALTSSRGATGVFHELIGALEQAASRPVESERLRVQIAVNYDGRSEIAAAARRLALDSGAITAQRLQNHLQAASLPPVDLLVRTGGETRLSDFLLWQAAYAELLFLGTPWTRFGRAELRTVLGDYARRRRTFGALPTQRV